MCIGMYVLSNMANMLPHQPHGPYASAYPSIVGWLYHAWPSRTSPYMYPAPRVLALNPSRTCA
ncbi:MAG: hypothetical protein ACPIOQ_49825, partial [Promethearchaeia archaeon]